MPQILYDATHLIAHLGVQTPTGIDRVDAAYAKYLAARPDLVGGIVHGSRHPRMLAASRVADLAARQTRIWERDDDPSTDPSFAAVRQFLIAGSSDCPVRVRGPLSPLREMGTVFHRLLTLAAQNRRFDPPRGSVYLNVAQYASADPMALRWLDGRRDVKPVFMLHDMIPIEFPHFVSAGYVRNFSRMLQTMRRYAAGLIVPCEATRKQITEHFKSSVAELPIHVFHLPAGERFSRTVAADPELAAVPFVLMVGTIVPRKNHAFLLKLWRRFHAEGRNAPRLLIVGAERRNWNIMAELQTSPELKGQVMHVSGLSDSAYRYFLGHARALLLPSFAEGYGIPLVESATAGVPVLASDLGVFREICQGKGLFISLSDEDAWARSILELSDPAAAARQRERIAGFAATTWDRYFESLLGFLARL